MNVLSLNPLGGSMLLLRLEHTFGPGEHPTLSLPINVRPEEMFTFDLRVEEEMELGGNRPLWQVVTTTQHSDTS